LIQGQRPASRPSRSARCRDQLARIRDFLIELATEAGVADPDHFARQWHILMKGSIVSAGEGDTLAAKRAQEVGRLLLAHALAPSPHGALAATAAASATD